MTLKGHRGEMRVDPNCNVMAIKAFVSRSFEIASPSMIRLVVNGEALEDNGQLIKDSILKSGDTIYVAEPTRIHIPSRIESWGVVTGKCLDVCVGLGGDELPRAVDFGADFQNLTLRARAPLTERARWIVRALSDGSILTLGNGGEMQRWL